MIRNYLKSAFRNLFREKTSALLNLSGLTLGITCSIILMLLISHHSSFDQYHKKKDRIYRIVYQGEDNGNMTFHAGVAAPLRDAFTNDFPEAEEVLFTSYRANALIRVPQPGKPDAKYVEEGGVVFGESAYFRIFDQPILAGDAQTSLDEPNKAVISTRLAAKYFNTTDVLGKVIEFGDHSYSISAVMTNPPENTDLPFDLMLSYITVKTRNDEKGWNSIWSDEHCYFLLKENKRIEDVQARLLPFTKKYRGDDHKGQFLVFPLTDFHFDTRFETYTYQTIPRPMLYVLGVIAAILVLTACINFINLATADAIKRSKEVGVRKTMGSTRMQLVFQFLGETTLVTCIAMVCSLALTQLALSFVNPFLGLNLNLDLASNPTMIVFLVVILVFVSLFSGFYPAMVVSSYSPALALKNKIANKASGGFYLRSALVVFQFFISQFFIIGTIVLIRQTDFFLEKDLGFVKDAILVVPMPGGQGNNEQNISIRKTLKAELSGLAGIEGIALGSAAPFSGEVNKTGFLLQGDANEYTTQYKQVDDDYLDVFRLKLLAGRNVEDRDTLSGVVANESFAKLSGFENPEDLVGTMVTLYRRDYPVLGVVKDFNTASLQNKIEPTLLFNSARHYKTMAIKVNTTHVAEVVEAVKQRWEEAYPDQLFEYTFLEENIRSFYDGQRRITSLLTLFTSIAIFIGCLGLFGLVSFMTNQKTKEIGVRKVLGASVENILITFGWSYVRLILVGFLLAIPLGWFVMEQFLNEFAYRIPLSPSIFLTALLVTIVIALTTVGYKSFRAAVANPVKSLRYE